MGGAPGGIESQDKQGERANGSLMREDAAAIMLGIELVDRS
jgi:hypothetical protein